MRPPRPCAIAPRATPHPAAEEKAPLHDAAVLWDTARRHLKPDEFSALWFFYREDLAVRELAKVLGKTTTHTKVILHRARTRLRDHLTGGLRDATTFSTNAIQQAS